MGGLGKRCLLPTNSYQEHVQKNLITNDDTSFSRGSETENILENYPNPVMLVFVGRFFIGTKI